MNAIGSPAADRPIGDRRDWLKLAGGMMFGAGVVVLLARKQADMSDWVVFFVLLAGALILLGLAFVRSSPGEVGDGWMGGWRTGFLVFGTLLLLGAFLQLVNAADGNPGAPLNLAWTFGLAGAVAVASSLVLRARVQMLVGALLWVVAWVALWQKLVDPTPDTQRWLLIVLAAIYLVAALVLARAMRPEASDLITVAGIAAVAASVFTLYVAFQSAISAVGGGGSLGGLGGVPQPGQGWNVFLLVVSLVLIGYSSRGPTRGPGYVGAVGLAAFVGLTGLDVVNRLKGDDAGGVVGWPLILLIGGGLLLAAGFVLRPGALGDGPGAGGPGTGGPGYGGTPGYGEPHGYGQPPPGSPPPGATPGLTQPGSPPPGATQPGVQQPPPPGQAPPPAAPPGQAPPGGQPGGLLDQWRQQPPPGAGPPPGQS
jgi:hypothetical protein